MSKGEMLLVLVCAIALGVLTGLGSNWWLGGAAGFASFNLLGLIASGFNMVVEAIKEKE